METIQILIADSNVLIREGLKSLLSGHAGFEVVGEAASSEELEKMLSSRHPNVVVVDYSAPFFDHSTLAIIKEVAPAAKMLAITDYSEKEAIQKALLAGLAGHLLKDCDRDEIIDAVTSVAKGEQFYCGKIIDALKDDSVESNPSCAPINLSEREVGVIKLVAEGKTNKEIADMLFLSTHTVMTHRKNVMAKLGVNNTAGIVIYAVKENIISPNKFLFAPN